MTPSYFIDKSFVTNIAFDVAESARLSPQPILHGEPDTLVEIVTRDSENDKYHLVKIRVHVSSEEEDGTPVYNLLLEYSAVVGSLAPVVTETDWDEILKVQVPHDLFDNIRSIVYQVTREAGFPFMMRDDAFDTPVHNLEVVIPDIDSGIRDFFEELTNDIFDEPESEKIDFQWMMDFSWAKDDPELLRSVQTFWAVYSSDLGMNSHVDYESLPIYKGYYRFFTPIEYLHPDFEECDESIWPILFQMLYGSFKSQCQVIDDEQDLPEIEFSFEQFQDRTVSSLTLEELKELLSDLITEALVSISVDLLDYQNTSVFSEDQPLNNRLLPKQDFFRLFDTDVSDETASLVNTMYERIKECDLQTVLYQN